MDYNQQFIQIIIKENQYDFIKLFLDVIDVFLYGIIVCLSLVNTKKQKS